MQTGIQLYIGRRGTGKSRLMRYVCTQAAKQGKAIYVHDPLNDWGQWGPYPESLVIYTGSSVESIAQHAIASAPCTLVYDEIRVALPGGPATDTLMTDIVTYGRHYQITLLGSTQRPALVSASLRALVSRAFVFQTTIQNDLKWIADNIDPDIAAQASRLGVGEYLAWS